MLVYLCAWFISIHLLNFNLSKDRQLSENFCKSGFPRLEENLGVKVTLNLQGEFVSRSPRDNVALLDAARRRISGCNGPGS